MKLGGKKFSSPDLNQTCIQTCTFSLEKTKVVLKIVDTDNTFDHMK